MKLISHLNIISALLIFSLIAGCTPINSNTRSKGLTIEDLIKLRVLDSVQIDSFLMTIDDRFIKVPNRNKTWMVDNGNSGCFIDDYSKNFMGYTTSGGDRSDSFENSLKRFEVQIEKNKPGETNMLQFKSEEFTVKREMVFTNMLWGLAYTITFPLND